MEIILASAVIVVICALAQQFIPSAKGQKLFKHQTGLDITYLVLQGGVARFLLIGIVSFFVTIILAAGFKMQGVSYLTSLSGVGQFVIIFVLADFTGYWMHRMFHSRKFWKFHAIHHSPKEIDFLTSARFHIVEAVLNLSVIYLLAALLFGYENGYIGLAVGVRAVYGYFVHANLRLHFGRLGAVIASPVFHRWHHTQEKEGRDKNFSGVFAVWDYLFGTAYLPEGGRKCPHNFGVKADVGNNYIQQLLYPFKGK